MIIDGDIEWMLTQTSLECVMQTPKTFPHTITTGFRREGLPQRALPELGARGERELGRQADCRDPAAGVHRACGVVRRWRWSARPPEGVH